MGKEYIGKKILSANEEYAASNRETFIKQKKLCFNMISSPGSGKTTILVKTINQLKEQIRIGVIEGDIQTEIDAERIRQTNAPAIQINTEGACHLSAAQVYGALNKLSLDELDLIFVENVGNLVCPSAFDLGETGKIVVLSVAEGDDKPAKYPGIFAKSQVLLINKIDLLQTSGHINFDIEKVQKDARKLNKSIKIFPISAVTSQGFDKWCDWLRKQSTTL